MNTKNEVQSVVPEAFYARLKQFLHINLLYSMLWKQILVMDIPKNWYFLPPHPKVCMHFLGPFTLVQVAHTEKRQQCWHKMGLQKGQYMQIQKSKMMKILPRVLWFWLLQRDINFKSFVQWQAKVHFSAPTPLGKHLFRGIGMLSWFLTAYATLYVEN